MYHIRRSDNGDERSLHKDDLEGLEAALREAVFRTHHTKVPHEVYDDVTDRVVHRLEPHGDDYVAQYAEPIQYDKSFHDAQQRKLAQWSNQVAAFFLSAALAALFLSAMLGR